VVKDGKVVREQAYGIANLEHNVPATKDTVFRVASMSKQFAAAAMMLLIQDGKATLDDSVRKHLPDAPETWGAIKLRHLLSHTSGMPDIGEAEGFVFETRMRPEAFLQTLYKKPLKRRPGEKFEYSNPGYSVLGLLVGRVAGKPLEEVVEERIFRPVGMTRTRYYKRGELVPNRAAGYIRRGDRMENDLFLRPDVMHGSGGIMSTVGDFVKWDRALETDSPLNQAIRDQVWTAHAPTETAGRSYGFGWFLTTNSQGKRLMHHSGGTLGFTSNFIRSTQDKLTVVVLMNVADGGAVALSEKIAEFYSKS
jgi:CubicO group peptidase (beta-lactamase class C family)